MAPFQLGDGLTQGRVHGCNAVDVNPAHGLMAFGTEGAGVVELWDQRARRRAGALNVATAPVMDAALSTARRGLPGLVLPGEDANEVALKGALDSLSVSALKSAQDGLNLAVGTSTGHTLLYDLRMDRPYATKDQGFSLPIKSLSWPGDAPTASSQRRVGASAEAKDTVLSADAKGIKVWPKEDPGSNLVSITPQSGVDLNDVHHLPGSGLVFAAVEGTQCAAWYAPILGPAPRWCSFLDRITDEIDEEQAAGGKRGVYEDFKFVDKDELEKLQMSHLIGSDVLRPYMHGYFVALPLYERARLMVNPTAFSDAREKAIQAKLEKKAESRIRSSGAKHALENLKSVQVNKSLAERAAREQARAEQMGAAADVGTDATEESGFEGPDRNKSAKKASKASLLSDDRFKELFTNPAFQVDESSREYQLLNPSSATGARAGDAAGSAASRRRTAVEEEEDESDRESLDPDQEEDEDDEERNAGGANDSDSSDEGDLQQFDPRNHAPGTRRRDLERPGQKKKKAQGARLVDDDGFDEEDAATNGAAGAFGSRSQRNDTFEGRLRKAGKSGRGKKRGQNIDEMDGDDGDLDDGRFAAQSVSWTPGTSTGGDADDKARRGASDSSAVATGKVSKSKSKDGNKNLFGSGLSKVDANQEMVDSLADDEKSGRKRRREIGRSASKNAMRR